MTFARLRSMPRHSPAGAVLDAARHHLRGHRGLMVVAVAVLATGLAANWSWLVAVGFAPLLLGVLPCLAMCALGLCMNKMSGRSCSAESELHVEPDATGTSLVTPAETAVVERQVASGDGFVGEPVVSVASTVTIDANPQMTRRNPDA